MNWKKKFMELTTLDNKIYKHFPNAKKEIPSIDSIYCSYRLSKRFHLIKWKTFQYNGSFELFDEKKDDVIMFEKLENVFEYIEKQMNANDTNLKIK